MKAKIEILKKVNRFNSGKRKIIRKLSETENSQSDNSDKNKKTSFKNKKHGHISQTESISDEEIPVSSNYEDTLFNEIERILIEIINNHVNYDMKKNETDTAKFEKHVMNINIDKLHIRKFKQTLQHLYLANSF